MTTRTWSTSGAPSNAATECSIIGRPASGSSCLGTGVPNRSPDPPASTTATVRMTRTLPAWPARSGLPARSPHGVKAVKHRENLGLAVGRDAGMAACAGAVALFLHDDGWFPAGRWVRTSPDVLPPILGPAVTRSGRDRR